MSDALSSSYANLGTNLQSNVGNARMTYPLAGALQSLPQGEGDMSSLLSIAPVEETPLVPDRSVAELAIRRLSKEIDHAKQELKELERTLIQELFTPSVREWLLPLMAIGLALSLYGSFSSSNSAELGATGLMLLWSLSAFWFIYTRDIRLEMAKKANKAEIEIWSSRIEELQDSLEQNQRVVEATSE